ncbi:sterol desaturase family protein [Planktotalea sp.]|uniref:sterol desaturase family protein n=1 Tax=Planktotalea sp. TaxID=2029877 RepID=UPI003D6C52D2
MTARIASQFFLLGLIAAMALLFILTRGTADQDLLLSGAALGLIGLSLGLERVFPLHPNWNEGQGDTKGDIASFALIFGALDSGLKYLSPFLILALLPDLGAGLAMPLWQQVIAVTLIIELGSWLSHFAHHRYPSLWALHAMHHASERLYTLNNFRFHPLNHVLNHVIAFLPPLALGFNQEALLAYTALSMPILLFQHSNVRFEFGFLNRVFNTNALHRWHHSSAPSEGTKNLGRALVLWDHLFGTYFNPAETNEPRSIGLFQSSKSYPKPRQICRQLIWPFNKSCCATP